MAWSIVGVGTVVEVTAAAITLTEPAGVANGDLLVACFASRTTATTAVTNTGWLPVNSQNNNNTTASTSGIASGTMLYQVRAGTPDLSFVVPAGISVMRGQIVAYRGGATTTPLDVSAASTTAATVTACSWTGLTTTQPDDLIVAMVAGGQEAAWSAFGNAGFTTAWSTTDKSANVTLSNADKTAANSTGVQSGVRSLTTYVNGTAGKYYAEVLLPASTFPLNIGISPTSNTLTSQLLTCCVVPSTGSVRIDATTGVAELGAFAASDIVCIAWDAGAERIWFRRNAGSWNGTGADPGSGTGGLDCSFASAEPYAVWMRLTSSIGGGGTVRTVLADFTQTVPTGFSAWAIDLGPLTASGATDTTTAPSSTAWIERADSLTTTGADTSLAIFDAVKTATGATGNLTATASVGGGNVLVAGAFKIAGPSSVTASVTTNLLTTAVGDVTVSTPAAVTRPTYGSLAQIAYGARTNVTQAVPASTVDGDLLIWCVVTGNAATPVTPSFPAGWTQIGSTQTGNDGAGFHWTAITGRRLASGEPANYTATHAACSSESLMVRVDNPAAETLDIDAFSQAQAPSTTGTTSTATSVTPVESDSLLVFLSMNWDITTLAPPTGMTERLDSSFIYLATQELAASGATGTRTQSHANNPWFGNLIAIKAAAAAGGVTVSVTGQSLTVSVDTASATGKAIVPTTTNLATVSVDQATVAAKANASTTTNLSTVSVNTATVAAKANTSVTTNLATVSVGDVTVSTTARVDVSVPVTGNLTTVAVDTATVAAKATAPTTTNLATVSLNGVTVSLPSQVSVTTNLATVSVNDVIATGKANAPALTNLLNVSIDGVTVTAGTGVAVTLGSQSLTPSVSGVTLTGKANVSLDSQSVTVTGTGVSVTAGGSVSTGVTGQQVTASVNDVTVLAKRSVSSTLASQQAIISVEPVTVTTAAGGLAGVAGQQIAVQCGSVTVSLGAAWEWDPSTLTGTGTFSHNGMTLTAVGEASIQSIVSHDDGLFYAETTFTDGDPVGLWGLYNSGADTGTMIVLESGDVVSQPSGTLIPTFAPIGDGDTAGLAYEADTGTVWFRVNGGPWNNDRAQSPDSTGIGLWEVPTDVGCSGTLTPYVGSDIITTEGTVFEDLEFPTSLYVRANNATFRNCSFNCTEFFGVAADAWGGALTGHVFDRCTFIGNGRSAGILTGNEFLVTHCDISGFENGIFVGSDGIVENCYIHDLYGSVDAHLDGIQFSGNNSNVIIRDNWIEAWDTSCILIKGDTGPIDNVLVENNTLISKPGENTAAPIFAVSMGVGQMVTDIRINRNRLQAGFAGDYLSLTECTPEAFHNIDYVTGEPVLTEFSGFPVSGQTLSVEVGLAYVMPIEPEGYDLGVQSGYVGLVGPVTLEPTFRSGSLSAYSYVADAHVAPPAGVTDGDLLFVALFRGKDGSTMSRPVPFSSGWTQLGIYRDFTQANFHGEFSVWWKRAGATEPDEYLWGYFEEANTQTWICAYSGCSTMGPIQMFSQNGSSSTTATGIGLDLIQLNSKLIWLGSNWTGSGSLTPPTGMTERADSVVYAADETVATYGPTGDRTQAQAENAPWTAFLVGLKGA